MSEPITDPTSVTSSPNDSLAPTPAPLVIGIGASAGGLEALRLLIQQLPSGIGVCYAIAQHLSPTYRSMLVELLSRDTALPVLEISDGLVPLSDHIYVTPASFHARYEAGAFRLRPTSQAGTPRPCVDELLESLALVFRERSVGIVLSGTGSDGTRGLRAIHAAGGHTIAQDPKEAKYDGMPRSAIESGCVAFVGSAREIGEQLRQLLAAPPAAASDADPVEAAPAAQPLDRIMQIVRRRSGFDLSQYKLRSLERRTRRRVTATDSGTLEAYADLLTHSPDEHENLVHEMFISVTRFFRDPEAFEALDEALGVLLDNKPDTEELRIWVPGCATGEEAYSIAMLISRHFDRQQRWLNVRLFATDVDTAALAIARRGCFDITARNQVPAELADQYLTIEGTTCQICKRVRDMVIFSEHNLLRDPPFLRLDLVSCRNLLIYLQPEVQQHIVAQMAHALRDGGLLFLGHAEALHAGSGQFRPVHGSRQLYRLVEREAFAPLLRSRGERAAVRADRTPQRERSRQLGEWLLRAHTAGALAPLVVVDDDGQLLHVFGDASRYLRLGGGDATLNILRLAIEPLRLELRSILFRTQREQAQRVIGETPIELDGAQIRLVAYRYAAEGSAPLTLIMFDEREPAQLQAADRWPEQQAQRTALEDQLATTRKHLNTVISELESANEELQSLNEELQSANEELQSANEELETSNEELQSTNEELITVNEELESRSAELTLLNTDLHNVKNSLVDPIIVVDEHRRVTLFNPPATQIFSLGPETIGTLLFSLPCYIEVGNAAAALNSVIEQGRLIETQLYGKRNYLMRIQPYLDLAGALRGAVLTFQDNTEQLKAATALEDANERSRRAERFTSATIDAIGMQIGVIDAAGRVVSSNLRWREALVASGCLSDVHDEPDEDHLCSNCPPRLCVTGANYIAACELAAGRGDAPTAELLDGLLTVMRGESQDFSQEFRSILCGQIAHYLTTIKPFRGPLGGQFWVITHQDITQSKQQEALIRLQAKAMNHSLTAITIADAQAPDLPLIYVNEAFERITGYAAEEAIGRNCRFLQGNDRTQQGVTQMHRALEQQQSVRVLLRNYRKDGSQFWNEVTLTPMIDNGRLTHVVGLQRDMTAFLAGEQALKASLQRESQALAFAGLGSMEWDIRNGMIVLSERHAQLLGLPQEQQALTLGEYRALIIEEDRALFDDSIKLCVARHSALDIEYRIQRSDGLSQWLHTRGNAIIGDDGVAIRMLALTQDISTRKDAEDRVRFIAHHDALTGLPNRSLLRDRFQLALNGARRNRTRLALVFIDLDHFKDINDSLGHDIGDGLLVSIADRMRGCLRDTDTICRQSGDEFIALMPGIRDVNDAAHLAQKIVEAIARPHTVCSQDIHITCSAGVSCYPDDGTTFDELMRHADSAMYHAKGRGRNTVECFAPEMTETLRKRLSIAGALREALARGELRLHYQAQLDVISGRLIGVEALLRWQHPQLGLLLPERFMPVAEDSDLIVDIGNWVLHQACQQARQWQLAGLVPIPMAVNVSPVQVRQRSFIGTVESALHDSGLDAQWLELELTEQGIIPNADSVGELLHDFRRRGIRLALDDFGTGFSSLSYLHRFPVHKLKIDRSFVAASPVDASAAAIVRAVINLARSMGLDIVAEGVETSTQLSFLAAEGCAAYQGFLWGPGVAADGFEQLVRRQMAEATAATH